MNTIDSLAGGDVTKYELIMEQPYSSCFIKMKMNLVTNQFNKRYSEELRNT